MLFKLSASCAILLWLSIRGKSNSGHFHAERHAERYQNESFSSKWELLCLPPSSIELWRRERASRQLSFWWKTLILIGHYSTKNLFLFCFNGPITDETFKIFVLNLFLELLSGAVIIMPWYFLPNQQDLLQIWKFLPLTQPLDINLFLTAAQKHGLKEVGMLGEEGGWDI